jgi:serine/threonine protein kinase
VAIDSNQLLGWALGTCTLEHLIGRGGMGAVYLAQQSRPRRSVAVKVLVPGLLLERRVHNEFLVRFRREADAIAALDHINIMPIYEYGEQEQLAYLVMPYVTGGTLREVLEQRGILPLAEVLPIIEQAASALDYAHKQGIVHRDLKPGNILFHADGRVLLADFGLAKVLKETTDTEQVPTSTLTSLGTVIGTPEYLSPEQATGSPVDQRTDIYSLGVILYQMLGGRLPFTGATPVAIAIKQTLEEPPPITEMNPALPRGVVAVIMKAIAKKPDQRYATAGELVRALRAAIPQKYHDHQQRPSTTKLVLGSEYTTPMSLLSNDTVLDLPALPGHDAETTLKTPQTPTPTVSTHPFPGKLAPSSPHEKRQGCQPLWMALLGCLLAVLIVVGGLTTYLHSPRGNTASSGSASGVAKNTPIASKGTPTIIPQSKLPAPLISAGKQIYGTTLPGTKCDSTGGKWTNSPNAQMTCGSSATEVKDTSTQYLAGTYLDTLPNDYSVPTNYVLQVQVSEGPGSHGKFGVFFRNQPGLIHQGTFSFLLDQSGHWYAYVYDDKTGVSHLLHEGQSTVPLDGLTTIDIIVSGSTFTFYLNGVMQGYAASIQYPIGTIGLAADVGADVFYKNLAIYALPN